jgi:hypothetical protein
LLDIHLFRVNRGRLIHGSQDNSGRRAIALVAS